MSNDLLNHIVTGGYYQPGPGYKITFKTPPGVFVIELSGTVLGWALRLQDALRLAMCHNVDVPVSAYRYSVQWGDGDTFTNRHGKWLFDLADATAIAAQTGGTIIPVY